MTKEDLINNVSVKTGLQKQYVQSVVNEVFVEMAEAVKRKEIITIRGLFTIATVKRKGKVGQDMAAHKTIVVPPCWTPKAKFCKEIKEHLKHNG